MELSVRVASVFQDTTVLSDEALGQELAERVRKAVERRQAPTVALIARPERLDFVGLRTVVEEQLPVQRFIAGLTRAHVDAVGAASAVGVMGTVGARTPDGSGRVPMAVVFLEWPDCRWWYWRALVDPVEQVLRADTETVRRAVDGDPLPSGFGRWWTVGRHLRRSLRFDGWPPEVADGAAMVH
jgi:hypothetical protein